ncbi:33889_t:CDS:2 [Gigaspora margarita]|uniref:33889_t:CDS:1 n=1 Tax=Gigaspora margarita TaxID=4874 RepID=A0ABN7VHK4_GIGMA|nr:33889_t:CDS:2 [Gigaspora margarita]
MESSNSEYSDPEYSDPEHLVYESEGNYEKNFNNKETELNEEEQHKNKGLREAAQELMSLDNFFKPVKKLEIKIEMSDLDISDSDIETNNSISEQINKLNNKLKNMKNMNAYKYLRLLAMHKYLIAIFNNEESYSCIDLKWSKSWITTETLPISKQRQQKYTQTFIDNEDMQNSCLHFIHTMEERITPERFQNYV